ncbi:MAG: DUF255 domain-containing protein [Planctomycetota bacterium]|jgi:uncharacterized protein YyaL (SSP411 family)
MIEQTDPVSGAAALGVCGALLVVISLGAAAVKAGEVGTAGHVRKQLPSPEERAKLPPDGGKSFNRLIHEKSPYLLQHARNPVDWYPWGKEALEKARREKKPIFLSVGYSTCHWCHVMERESFERRDVAELLNRHFVPVKVDREERPDVDAVYMMATQLMTGRGGWPNSVWLRPDGRPWYAGTYFPREDSGRMPGFKTILRRLAGLWKDRRKAVDAQADRLWSAMKSMAAARGPAGGPEISRADVNTALKGLREDYDRRYGGFGGAPKFPPHHALRLMIYDCSRRRDPALLEVIDGTLRAMAAGGIRDHLGGGFHRYSTDERWLLPHFEKMLYDNAQLSAVYVDAWRLTGRVEYRRVAEEAFDWVLREMTDEAGGFYSALDADSEGEEGLFYVWKWEELQSLLGRDAANVFAQIYGAKRGGNWRDEATGRMPGTNVLHMPRPLGEAARGLDMNLRDLEDELAASRRKLLAARGGRVRPHLDDKVLAGWNGLMIGALARGGKEFRNAAYLAAARKAAGFLLTSMRKEGRLARSWREGQAKGEGYLEDYAFAAWGLLDLHEATGERRWLDEATELVRTMQAEFADGAGGYYFSSARHKGPGLRARDPFDRALPSGIGAAAIVLARLSELDDDRSYTRRAAQVLSAFRGFVRRQPSVTGSLVLAAAMLSDAEGTGAGRGIGSARAHRGVATIQAGPAAEGGVEAGREFVLRIGISLQPGFHINSAVPLQSRLVPASVQVASSRPFTAGEPRYPEGREMRPEDGGLLSVYDSGVRIDVPVLVSADADERAHKLSVAVRFQACSDTECLKPETVKLEVPIRVVKAAR